MKPTMMFITALIFLVAEIPTAQGFAPRTPRPTLPVSTRFVSSNQLQATTADALASASTQLEQDDEDSTMAVRAPLKFRGPYPCLGLTFPDLATASQRERNISGISLDFVLDTAANTNTINAQVAQELGLPKVGEAPSGVSAGGAMNGGSTFLLGKCELEGIPKDQQFTFMEDLTASALPVASPASAGLLSLPFFHCFEGGVEFQWQGQSSDDDQQQQVPPSVTFYGPGESDGILQNMTRVQVTEMPVTRLPVVQLRINNVTVPALLDTGSPITVINAKAAAAADIQTVEDARPKQGGNNPFAKFANRFQEAQEAAKAAARGDIITIAGTNGEPVRLYKSNVPANIHLRSVSLKEDEEKKTVDFGTSDLYVGNLPGLAALNGLNHDSPPAAVLGMDVLRLRPKMLFVARSQEVYF